MDPYAIAGKPTTSGEVLQSAVVGAVSGAVSGLVGPEAGPVAKVAVGALANGVGQMAGNALSGKPLMDGVGEAVVSGAITGGVMEGAGSLLEGMGGKVLSSLAEDCGLSFAANTQVATPHGKQAIGTLKPGETVQSYDPVTRKVSTQTVQRVFINHDTDLLDVTLQVSTSSAATAQNKHLHVAVKSHGSHAPPQVSVTEVVHTTQKHPWLTTTGWRIAGQLHVGDHVVRLDGTTATVIALRVVPGTAAMYDLTVSTVHTFAVGSGQYVVHNCGDNPNDAQARADRIIKAGIEKYGSWFGRKVTAAVAHLTDEDGIDRIVVAMNNGSWRGRSGQVMSLLGEDEMLVEGTTINKMHAEQSLISFWKGSGWDMTGFGVSRAPCGPASANCQSIVNTFVPKNLWSDTLRNWMP